MRDLRRLLKYLRPHWPTFTLATLAMLLVGILESAIGGLIVPIFDQAFVQGAGQRTATIFGLQHLIPQAPLEAWKRDSLSDAVRKRLQTVPVGGYIDPGAA